MLKPRSLDKKLIKWFNMFSKSKKKPRKYDNIEAEIVKATSQRELELIKMAYEELSHFDTIHGKRSKKT